MFFFVLSAVLLENVENIKSTTSHAKRAQKVHNFLDDLTTKISTTNSTTNHKKTHKKKTQRLGLKSTTSLIIFAQQQAKEKIKTSNLIYIWHRPQLHQQKKHKKCTTSLMVWPQKLAQQTSQLHQQKTQKVHNFPDDLATKISTTNSTTNHKKTHKKKHNV